MRASATDLPDGFEAALVNMEAGSFFLDGFEIPPDTIV
jgi:hypothetical protein